MPPCSMAAPDRARRNGQGSPNTRLPDGGPRVDIGPSSPAATTGQSNLTSTAQLLQVFIDTPAADLGYLSVQ